MYTVRGIPQVALMALRHRIKMQNEVGGLETLAALHSYR